jgi:hypothetical protein
MRLAAIWLAPTGLWIHETPIPLVLLSDVQRRIAWRRVWAGMLRTVGAEE